MVGMGLYVVVGTELRESLLVSLRYVVGMWL